MNYEIDQIVFIGRFQPFHEGHRSITDEALKRAKKLIIVIGSHHASLDMKNPWTFEERKEMVLKGVGMSNVSRVTILPLRDYMYSDMTWITSLRNTIDQAVPEGSSTALIGHFKDDSSEYLNFFPQWPLLQRPNYKGINATDIRDVFFRCYVPFDANHPAGGGGAPVLRDLPAGLALWLKEWKDNNPERFNNITEEIDFLTKYNEEWAGTPYPINFVTTDAVVVQSGHVLMVRRKHNPGKDKLALPGGFVGIHEKIEDSCVRELYEETNIAVRKTVIRNYITAKQVFDHPKRSGRGRIITHAYYFQLEKGKPLPTVVGADDAYQALWVPLEDLASVEEDIFSDHIHIIHHFTRIS